MKIISLLFFGLSLICCHSQLDNRSIPYDVRKFEKDFPNGKTFILSQLELDERYSNNYSLYATMKNQFLNLNNPSSEIVQSVSIDLSNIQVFEDEKMHNITYKIDIGEREYDENNEPLVVYNLSYFSSDYQTYYFTLLKYDFSEISYKMYSENPKEHSNILTFIPLTDIGNIYENIAYSFSQEMLEISKKYPVKVEKYKNFIEFAKCAEAITVAAVPCKSCGLHLYEEKGG